MELNLQDRGWKEFRIGDVFEVSKGVYLPKKKIKVGKVPYITAKSENNGVTNFIENEPLFKGKSITIGKVDLSAYYQPKSFYCSHDVSVISNSLLNEYNGQFICNMINRQGFKYSYGRQAQLNVVKSEKIFLPINREGNPDYAFMEAYIKQKEHEKLDKYNKYIYSRLMNLGDYDDVENLDEKKWGEFKIQDLFDTKKGNQNKMSSLKKGDIPLISAKKENNGLKDFVLKNNKDIYENHSLTLNNDGDGGAGISFYQPFSYLLDSHVTYLKQKQNLSRLTLLFISRCITKQRNRFGHGYSLTNKRLSAFKIMLPMNQDNKPDYEYMENYMKFIEYKKLSKYLAYKNI